MSSICLYGNNHVTRTCTTDANAPAQSRMVTHSPIFFGWFVMLAGSFGLIMTSPGQTYGISVFIEHFITDLGVSRSLVSTYYAIGTLTGAAMLPFVGRRIDHQGPRSVVVVVAVLFGLACVYMGLVTGGLMLLFGFTLIRMLGQGSLSLVSNYTINQWWMRRRGMVVGISGVLMALLGMGAFPNLLNWLIGLIGWRPTYMTMGLALIFVMAPVGYLFYRSRPERYGLLPDGSVDQKRRRTEPDPGLCRRRMDVVRSPAYARLLDRRVGASLDLYAGHRPDLPYGEHF